MSLSLDPHSHSSSSSSPSPSPSPSSSPSTPILNSQINSNSNSSHSIQFSTIPPIISSSLNHNNLINRPNKRLRIHFSLKNNRLAPSASTNSISPASASASTSTSAILQPASPSAHPHPHPQSEPHPHPHPQSQPQASASTASLSPSIDLTSPNPSQNQISALSTPTIDLTLDPDSKPKSAIKLNFGNRHHQLALSQAAQRRIHDRSNLIHPLATPSITPNSLPINSQNSNHLRPFHHPPPHPHISLPASSSSSLPWPSSSSSLLSPPSQFISQTIPNLHSSQNSRPICIGLLSSLVLIIYRLKDFDINVVGRDGKIRPQTLPVSICRFPPNGSNEILKVLAPNNEQFGVVEHKVGNVIGPLLGPIHSISGGSVVGGWLPAPSPPRIHSDQLDPKKHPDTINNDDDDEITETDGLGGKKLIRPSPSTPSTHGRQLWIECCVIRKGEQNPLMLPLQLLLFCMPDAIPSVAAYLSRSAISLEHPLSYRPEMHLGCLYNNPHSSQPREAMDSIRQRLLGSSTTYPHPPKTTVKANDMHQQVTAIFQSLASGVDLDETEPNPIILTPLYPHQKQALSFMLDRETLKHVPEDNKSARSPAERKLLELQDDQNLVSLWKKSRDTYGRHIGWLNVVTGIQQIGTQTPTQCRGAILADDMGLGKTISIISLIATTLKDAEAYANTPITKPTPPPGSSLKPPLPGPSSLNSHLSNGSDSSRTLSTSTLLDRFGDLGASSSTSRGKQKKEGNMAAKKRIAADDRFKLIKLKSRATLIVCPLSTVQNWESQIEEHVRRKPSSTGQTGCTGTLSVCVYHGNGRTSDVNVLANYDVVITTYSLLGYEFSRQNRSTKEDSEPNDSSDGVEEVDGEGNVLVAAPAVSEKASAKGKRRRKGDGLPSLLQAIQWFRVVLDEAHMIKEHTTTQSKAACDLVAERRVCLTGTPLQNSLNDLFSLLCFLRLEPFTDRALWTTHIGTLVKLNDQLGVSRLRLIMRHIALRRTKQSVDKTGKPILTLPRKKDDIVYLELNEHEKRFYALYHQRSRKTFKTLEKEDTVLKNYCSILQELLRLRQICVHMGLVLDSEPGGSLTGRELDLTHSIELDGFSRSKAVQLLILMRETGATQCSECGQEAIATSTGENMEEIEDLKALQATTVLKRGRKPSMASAKKKAKPSALDDPDTKEQLLPSVVTKCQHLFCVDCFRQQMCAEWAQDNGADVEQVECLVCAQQLSHGTDIFEISSLELDKSLRMADAQERGEEQVRPKRGYKGRAKKAGGGAAPPSLEAVAPIETVADATKGESTTDTAPSDTTKSLSVPGPRSGSKEKMQHSTKVSQLILDLLPFSQANPASANYSPHEPMFNGPLKGSDEEEDPEADFKPTKGTVVKSVVFSQWTKLLDKIAEALEEFKIGHTRLDGTMSRLERAQSMEQLKSEPKCEVLLVSLRAGGVGLNLTCAQRVYLMEPFWNPAVENQAVDRVHRLGQTKPVRMIRYIIAGSVEQSMLEIQKRKTELANMSLGQTLSKAELARRRVEDLNILFKGDLGVDSGGGEGGEGVKGEMKEED